MAWDSFVRRIARAATRGEVERALAIFLTSNERAKIAARGAAIQLLQEGKSYRKIGDMLWLSPAIISALKKSLREGKGYVPRAARWKTAGRKKKQYAPSPFHRAPDIITTAPSGTRAFPRRVHVR